MSAKRKLSLGLLLAAAFLGGIVFTSAGSSFLGWGEHVTKQSLADPATAPGAALEIENTFVNVAERINPTVVQIHSEKVTRQQMTNPFEGSPFEQFFRFQNPNGNGQGDGPSFRAQALGSGVILREDGYIVTNNHVIDGADALKVNLYDGRQYDAKVVGADSLTDLAVIKIDASGLPAIPFGDAAQLRVGQFVMAFGSPLSDDLGNTVTSGIISAIGRTSAQLTSLNTLSAFIQTDAAINPGNSGGALVDLQGQLIGINSAIYSRSGGSQGIGFAIPVDVVQNITTQLIDGGRITRGFLGVQFGRVSPSLAEAMKVPHGAAQVTEVRPGTPAARAGLQEGDIIVGIDGRDLRDPNQLRTTIANRKPGDVITLQISRDGTTRTLPVTLGTMPDNLFARNQAGTDTPEEGNEGDASTSAFASLGVSLQDLTPALAERLGLQDRRLAGAVVVNVDSNSEAYREGDLRNGDILTEVDKKAIRNVREFMTIYRNISGGKTFLVRVLRPGPDGNVATFFTALQKPD